MDGQLLSKDQVNSFNYVAPVDSVILQGEDGELITTPQMLRSVDPSIGITKTKTIHFVDSSIKRLGDYTYQSFYGNKQTGELTGEDKGMIVNIAEEIYNISSRNVSGILYRQVLGEKLVVQQQQSLNLMKAVMNTVSDFAASTQILLDAFLDHTHALPKIDLNLEKTIDVKDTYRTPPILEQQPNLTVNLPGPYGGKISIPQPPKVVSAGQQRTRTRTQELNFEAIIGGSENPRFTARVQTDKAPAEAGSSLPGQLHVNQQKTELGEKTGQVDIGLETVISKFTRQRQRLNELTLKVNQFLSKNQFVN